MDTATPSANTLTWLHLADLQLTAQGPGPALQTLLQDIRLLVGERGLRPDLILVTGDIASAGQDDEYQPAARFFRQLLSITGLERDRLFLIPGNHDVNRERISSEEEPSAKAAMSQTAQSFAPDSPSTRFDRFSGYAAFASRMTGMPLMFGPDRHAFTQTVDVGGRAVAVLGFNTAWRDDPDEALPDELLALCNREIPTALEQTRSAAIKIALFHHSPNWMLELGETTAHQALMTQCDFVLHAHRSDAASPPVNLPSEGTIVIDGGSDANQREHPNTYNVVRLDGDAAQGEIYWREWSEKTNGWSASERYAPEGITRFALSPRLVSAWLQPSAAAARPVNFLAGYANDEAAGGQPDQLGITEQVHAFGAVLAARDVTPPLCLGLFGDWGSGKSFFMDKLEQRIRVLADQAQAAESAGQDTAFYSRIAHIRFNAWHYIDANLWASLVSHILEELSAFLKRQGQDAQRAQLFRQLQTAQDLRDQAERDKQAAEDAREQAERQLAQLAREREEKSLDLKKLKSNLLDRLLSKPENEELKQSLQTATQQLGLPQAMQTAEELDAAVQELRTLRGRAQSLWLAVFHAPGRRLRLGLLVVLLAAVPLMPLIVNWIVQGLSHAQLSLGALGTAVTQVTTFILGITTWLNQLVSKTSDALTTLEQKHAEVQKLIQDSAAQPNQQELALQHELAVVQEREAAAKKQMAEAQARVNEAERQMQELDQLQDGRQLAQFIQERIASQDYRKELGIISTIRQDLDDLSKLVSRPLLRAAEGQEPTARIDRIILYIDDLDRCPEKRVVEVLQAVHLLLAFKLFIVVVGVDSRWLLHSLEQVYPALRAGAGQSSGWSDEETWAWESTPQNYLEKIFQIPYNLRPMGADGFRNLVANFLPVTAAPPAQTPPVAAAPPMISGTPAPGAPRPTPATPPPAEAPAPEPAAEPGPAPAAAPEPTPDMNPEFLRVEPVEREFMEQLGKLIPTPRAAKRFINIYRLIRATVAPSDLPRFVGDAQTPGEFRAVMVMLAVLTGFPRHSPFVFRQILSTGQDTPWPGLVNSLRPQQRPDTQEVFYNGLIATMSLAEAVEWKRLYGALNELHARKPAPPTQLEVYKRWAHRVARFSFRVGKVADSHSLSADMRIVHVERGGVQIEHASIKNAGDASQLLTGWTLSDRAHHTFTFPAMELAAGATVNVWTGSGTATAHDLYWGRKAIVWNEMGDTAYLRDAAGGVVFEYTLPSLRAGVNRTTA